MNNTSLKYDKYSNRLLTFRFSNVNISKPLILSFGIALGILYVLIPRNQWGGDLILAICKLFWLMLAALIILPRTRNSPVVNGLIIFVSLTTLIIDVPTSLFHKVVIENSYKSLIIWKLNSLLVQLSPIILLSLIYLSKPKLFKTYGAFSIDKKLYLPDKSVRLFTDIFITFTALYLLVNLLGRPPLISYLLTIFFYTTNWYFFWIGFYNKRLGPFKWYISIILNLLHATINFLSGGRYTAILLLVIMGLGYYVDSPSHIRRIIRLNLLWLIPFIFILVGLLGSVRNVIERGDLSIVANTNRLTLYWNALVQSGEKYIDSDVYRESLTNEAAGRTKGGGALERVIDWTPEKIPYRGSNGLIQEFEATFKIASVNQNSYDLKNLREDRVQDNEKGLGTGIANMYGFYVTDLNSVEFPLAADAYSRGGLFVVFLYYFIIILFFLFIEKQIRKRAHYNVSKIILMTCLANIVYSTTSSYPLYYTIRMTFLYLIFISVFLYFTNLFFIRKYIKRRKMNLFQQYKYFNTNP